MIYIFLRSHFNTVHAFFWFNSGEDEASSLLAGLLSTIGYRLAYYFASSSLIKSSTLIEKLSGIFCRS